MSASAVSVGVNLDVLFACVRLTALLSEVLYVAYILDALVSNCKVFVASRAILPYVWRALVSQKSTLTHAGFAWIGSCTPERAKTWDDEDLKDILMFDSSWMKRRGVMLLHRQLLLLLQSSTLLVRRF